MNIPTVLSFDITPTSNSAVIRSVMVIDHFSKLTSNVEVLYPTQVHCGLLLCKSKRTEEKILNMRHVLSNGSTIHLSRLSRPLFQQVKCLVNGKTMQLNEISRLFQQCLPFLHASDGNIQINPDKSVLLEGHIFIVNAIHCFLLDKLSKPKLPTDTNSLEPLTLRSGNLIVKVISGKLIEQNIESIVIPMNGKCKIHKAFEKQIQSIGGINIINYFKELTAKGLWPHEGDIITLQNQNSNVPIKVFTFFIVPYILTNGATKDKSVFDSFQPIYEQKIYHALQTIEQNGITTFAMPVLEPSVKYPYERSSAIEMTVRAMVSAVRQYSQNVSMKIKRINIVDHDAQIKRMKKRVNKYLKQTETKLTTSDSIDLDDDDGKSFAYIFGVPTIPEILSSSSESDDEIEPEDYQHPYKHQTKV